MTSGGVWLRFLNPLRLIHMGAISTNQPLLYLGKGCGDISCLGQRHHNLLSNYCRSISIKHAVNQPRVGRCYSKLPRHIPRGFLIGGDTRVWWLCCIALRRQAMKCLHLITIARMWQSNLLHSPECILHLRICSICMGGGDTSSMIAF